MRKLRNLIMIIIVIGVAFWLLKKSNVIPTASNFFKSKPVVIDETPILIQQIRSIGQLITYTFYDEVVADTTISTRGSAFVNSFNRLAPLPFLPSADKQLVLIGRGKILAGLNLALLGDSSITVDNDTITVFLPKAQIIDAIVNPSDFQVFIEKGQLTSQEVTLVKLQARRKLESRAIQQNILAKANEKAKSILTDFLANLGYKKVLIY